MTGGLRLPPLYAIPSLLPHTPLPPAPPLLLRAFRREHDISPSARLVRVKCPCGRRGPVLSTGAEADAGATPEGGGVTAGRCGRRRDGRRGRWRCGCAWSPSVRTDGVWCLESSPRAPSPRA